MENADSKQTQSMLRIFILLLVFAVQLNAQSFVQHEFRNGPKPIKLDARSLIDAMQSASRNQTVQLNVPAISSKTLELRPYELMSPEYQAEYPDLKVFKWQSGDTYGVITTDKNDMYITTLENGHLTSYYPKHGQYFKDDGQSHAHHDHAKCGVTEEDQASLADQIPQEYRDLQDFGETRRRYRLAAVATGEYYQANGGNNAAVNTHLLGSIAGIELIYSKELSVTFQVLTPVLFNNPNSDPFTPDQMGGDDRPSQAATVVGNNFNISSYDIGHVFHTHADGDGWSNGGVARLASVCQDFGNAKAAGWSGSFNNNGSGWFQLAAHEFAHMFSATHTFNGSGELACDGAISETSAYEIGSGTTIMSYNGVCADGQNIPNSGEADSYFHTHSLQQMMNFIETSATCGTANNSNNTPPTVDINPCNTTYSVPKGTPFFVEAAGSDADGDALSYCWEQYNEDGPNTPTQGFVGNAAGNSSVAPLFRSYPPTTTPRRHFPRYATTLANDVDIFDVLPRRARDLNFRLTVRDNKGAFAMDDLEITVANVGPVRILSPNGGEAQTSNDPLNITWATGGAESICDVVDIYLSIDGGVSDYLLLGDDVNFAAGSLSVNLPSSITSTESARIILRCADNSCVQFYDVSDNNFSLVSSCKTSTSALCDTESLEVDQGSPALDLGLDHVIGESITKLNATISNSDALGPIAIFNGASTGCEIISNNYFQQTRRIQISATGTYNFSQDLSNGTSFISIYNANYNPNNPCQSFVASSAVSGGVGFFPSSTFSVELEACKEYVIGIYSFETLPFQAKITDISGPSPVFIGAASNNSYDYTYIAVNTANNNITAISETSDFTTLPGGTYHVYGVQYKSSGPTPPANSVPLSWIGKSIAQLLSDGECILQSNNFKPVTVNSNCAITGFTLAGTEDCNPNNNTFGQDIIFTFDGAPTTGSLLIDVGYTVFDFPINTNVSITNLISNGLPLDMTVSFSEDPSCPATFTNVLTAPVNCCPHEVSLGEDLNPCTGAAPTLTTAEVNGASYKWFRGTTELPFMSNSIEANQSGTYIVEVTNDTGCLKSDTITVTFQDAPEFMLDDLYEDCAGKTIEIDPEIGQADFTYQWTKDGVDFASTEIVTITESGQYCLTATHSNGCPTQRCTNVNFKPTPEANLGDDIPACEGDEVTLSTPAVDNGNYEWYRDNMLVSNGTDNMIMPTVSGAYMVIVSNGTGCIGRDTAMVSFSPSPTIVLEDSYLECDGQLVSLNPQVNDPNLNYQWTRDGNPAGNSEVINVSLPGEYCLTASLPSGCGDMKCTMVSFIPAPTADLGDDLELCAPAMVTLTPGNNNDEVSYQWTQDGNPISTDPTINVTSTGVYAVAVQGGSCTSRDTINILVTETPTVDLGEDFVLCDGNTQEVSFATTPEMTFAWQLDGSVFASSSGGPSHQVSEGGQYIVNLELNGCVGTDTLNVELRSNPVVSLGEDKIACIDSEVILNAGNEGLNFVWSRNNNPLTESSGMITITETGMYRVVVTDDAGCSASDEINIEFIPGPTLDIGAPTIEFCEGNTATINATTNGTSIKWLKDGTEISGATNMSLVVSESGTYLAQVSGESDCIVEAQVVVTVFDNPSIMLSGENNICQGDQAVITAQDESLQYTWTDMDGNVVGASSSLVTEDAGNYTVVATNSNTCTATESIEITVTARPEISLDASADICEGSELTLDGGGSADSYQWFANGSQIAGANTSSLTVNSAGSYRLEATNGANCTSTAQIGINVNPLPQVNLGADQNVCIGTSVTLSAENGSSYLWSNQSTDASITITYDDLATDMANSFAVTVTDANDCSNSDEVVLTPIVESQFAIEAPEIACTGDTISMSVMAFDGGSTDMYRWEATGGTLINDMGTSVKAASTTDATYTVHQVTACGETGNSISINIPIDTPSENLSAGRDTCVIQGRSINLLATGGVSFMWEDNGTFVSGLSSHNPEVMPVRDTTYKVFITNQNGCTYSDEVKVCILTDPLSLIKPINIITPNGDGKNDVLRFEGLDAFTDNRLRIYSRWGTVIFDAEGYQQNSETLFDGMRMGEELPADTYYYVLEVEGKVIQKSHLTIIRD